MGRNTWLRWGEVGAAQVADVELLRGAVTVSPSLERRGTVAGRPMAILRRRGNCAPPKA